MKISIKLPSGFFISISKEKSTEEELVDRAYDLLKNQIAYDFIISNTTFGYYQVTKMIKDEETEILYQD